MTKKVVKADISYRLISSPKKAILKEIPIEKRGFVLLRLSKFVQQKLLDQLNTEEIVNILNYLAPDDITDLLQNVLDKKKRTRPRYKKKSRIFIKIQSKNSSRFNELGLH